MLCCVVAVRFAPVLISLFADEQQIMFKYKEYDESWNKKVELTDPLLKLP